AGARKLLKTKQLMSTCTALLWQTAPRRSIFHIRRQERRLLRRLDEPVGDRAPQLRPIREVLPASPLGVAAQHRLVGGGASLVVALAHEATEFRIDGDEVVAAVHGQKVRRAVWPDARQRAVALEQLLGRLRRIGDPR